MRSIGVALAFALAAVPACGSSSSAGPDGDHGNDAGATRDGATSGGDGGKSSEGGTGLDATSSNDTGALVDAPTSVDAPAESAPVGEAGTTQAMQTTFYGWEDNSPPGNGIAYPKSDGNPTVHDGAGGTGTYDDPITFATDPTELAPGTLVYDAVIEKYLIMEDSCAQCETDWKSHKWHIDIWMNSDGSEQSQALFDCEDQWTLDSTPIEINPPQGRTVTVSPLFVPASNTCRTSP